MWSSHQRPDGDGFVPVSASPVHRILSAVIARMRWQAGDYQILWEIGERGLSKEIKFNPKVMLCPNCRQVSTFLVNFSRFHSISFKSRRDFISKARGWVKKSMFIDIPVDAEHDFQDSQVDPKELR